MVGRVIVVDADGKPLADNAHAVISDREAK
jgi:hypothetical protein